MDFYVFSTEMNYVHQLRERGLYPYFNALETAQDSEVLINGKRTIMLGSNNYMGLTNDPRTIQAAKLALDKFGTGCSGSRFLNGTLVLHQQLESELAQFFGKADAIAFSTGYQTNLGAIGSVANRHTYILNDSENHASILDACRLSFAKRVYKFEHSNMDSLCEKLDAIPEDAPKLIITDGVFSMRGDIAKLPMLVEIKKKYNAMLMVDDAHGVGMIGSSGRGTADYFGLTNDVDIIMTTFSKSLASLGGCVAVNSDVGFFIRHNARSFIFSASIPPASAACALEALHIIQNEPERCVHLLKLADYYRSGLKALGIPLLDSETAIIPIITENMERTLVLAKKLLDNGVYVNPVLPPAVADDMCLLRTSLTAVHTKSQIDFALSVFEKVFHTN